MDGREGIELGWIIKVLHRWVWLILGCTALAALAAFVVTSRLSPVYEATTTLFVEAVQEKGSFEYNTIVAGERRALTYSQMLKGRNLMEAVISKLGLEATPDDLAERITVEPIQDTQLIHLTARDSSPSQAVLLANTLAEEFAAYIRTLQAARYADALVHLQTQIDESSRLVQETQLEIDQLNASKIEQEARVSRLESLLVGYRSDYQMLQQSYQTLQLRVSGITDSVNIVEPAQVPEAQVQFPYTATVTLMIGQASGILDGGYSTTISSDQLAATFGMMLVERSVLEGATAQLGITESPDDLAARVKVDVISDSRLIRLSVEDADASQAVLLANTISEVFIEQFQALMAKPYTGSLADIQEQMDEMSSLMDETQAEIEVRIAGKAQAEGDLARLEGLLVDYRNDYRTLQQDYKQLSLTSTQEADSVVIAEPAQNPDKPLQRRVLLVALAMLISLTITSGIAFLMEYLDNTIKTPQDVSQVLGLGTLGTIGLFDKGGEELIIVEQPRAPVAEAFRVLATNIRYSSLDKPLRILLVTSVNPGEGKSIVLANLAAALAQSELSVSGIDADLHLPRLHELYRLYNGEGLTRALLEGKADGRLQPTSVEGLTILTTGNLPPDPAAVVGSNRMRKLLEELANSSDIVLVDSPPVLSVADTARLASMVDGVLLVLQVGHTRSQAALEAVETLHQVGAHIIGVVLNGAANRQSSYYRNYEEGSEKPVSRLHRWKQYLSVSTKILKRGKEIT